MGERGGFTSCKKGMCTFPKVGLMLDQTQTPDLANICWVSFKEETWLIKRGKKLVWGGGRLCPSSIRKNSFLHGLGGTSKKTHRGDKQGEWPLYRNLLKWGLSSHGKNSQFTPRPMEEETEGGEHLGGGKAFIQRYIIFIAGVGKVL